MTQILRLIRLLGLALNSWVLVPSSHTVGRPGQIEIERTQRVGDRLVKGCVPDLKIVFSDPGPRIRNPNYGSGTRITIKDGSGSGSYEASFVTFKKNMLSKR
jgi:hypothetical protein